MTFSRYKTWCAAFGSVLFFLLPSLPLESCAGGDWDDWALSRFFDPDLTAQPAYRPLYFSFDRLYDDGWLEDKSLLHGENLRDWAAACENQPKSADIEAFVYTATRKDAETVKASLANPAVPIKTSLKNNSLVKYLVQKKDAATLDYLIFAKTCEPLAVQGNEWADEPAAAPAQQAALVARAEQASLAAATPFLKLRYAYQGIRLAHYARAYPRAIALYDKLVVPLSVESPVRYWALGHKAGAIRRSGRDNALAAYLFAVVFDKSESKRINAYYSFFIGSDADWKKAMGLCRNAREKSTLHFLRALKPDNLMLEEMRSIYALDPSSNYLDILLVRELNKYEVKKAAHADDLPAFTAGTAALKAFVFKGLSEGRIKNAPLWTLALGYTDYLAGNPREARQTFAQLPAAARTPAVKRQMDTFERMIQLAEIRKLDAATEERLYQSIAQTKSDALMQLMVNVFAGLYKQQGERAKAYLSHHDLSDLRTAPEPALVAHLLAFAGKPAKTAYERILLRKIDEKKAGDVLLEMQATALLRAGRLEEADKIFGSISYQYDFVAGNPAEGQLKDCHECAAESGKQMTKREFIAQIRSLQAPAAGTGRAAAEANYTLGNLYYNTTYFGFAWNLMAYYRANGFQKPQPGQPDYNHFDCTQALAHYAKAADLARQAGLHELAARSLFMAAKCEQNAYYLRFTPKADDDYYEGIPPSYAPADRKYFTQLKQQYAETELYAQASRECLYLNRFK